MSYETHPVRLVGGRLILDFLNTADWSSDGRVAHEKLKTRRDLTTWLSAVEIDHAVDRAASADLSRIRTFRARVRDVFLAAWSEGVDARAGIDTINKAAGSIPGDLLDLGDDGRPRVGASVALPQLLAVSAAAVLSDVRELRRIKLCPGDDCGWLFLDETKNGRRRWCTMETCGNRAKASRHYRRRKAAVG